MCPNNPALLMGQGAQWNFVKRHLDGLQLYIGWVNKCPPDALKKMVVMLKENNIKLSIECGGTLGHVPVDENNGRESAQKELRAVDKVAAVGGKVDYLNMDGPVSRLLYTGRHRFDFGKRWSWKGLHSIEPCVDQLVIYMETVRAKYPDIRFFTLTNFPNWGFKGGPSYHARHENKQDWGDYFNVISTIIPRAKAAEMPLLAVTVDNPYDYAVGMHSSRHQRDPKQVNWMGRIRELEDYVKSQGLEFNLIINTEAGARGSDERFCRETLQYLDAYRAAGGSPKRYFVQTWMQHPKNVVPETAPHTMTALAKEVIKRVKGVSE